MSAATTAAKRRRAGNIVSTPLFKPTSAPIENSVQRRTNISQSVQQQQQQQQQQRQQQQQQQQPQTHNTTNITGPNMQRPMSLQQVISVFDKRLLHIEGHILKNGSISHQPTTNSSEITQDIESLKVNIRENLDGQFSEFDHRYQVLASEISNLKQIVLKLQGYSLEINKSLLEERNEILSRLDTFQGNIEDAIVLDASTNTMGEENISFLVSSSDVKQEFIENATDESSNVDIDHEEVVEQQVAEPKEEEYTEEEIAYNKIDDVMFNKKCLNTDIIKNVKLEEEEVVEEQVVESKEDEVVEEQVAEPKEDKVVEEQVAEPKEDKVVEEQVAEPKDDKQKRKRKNKNVVAVSV